MSRKIGLGLPDRRVGLISDSDVSEAELAAVKKRVTDTEAEKVDKDTQNTITADHEVDVGSGFTFLNLANIKQQQFNVLDYGAKGDGTASRELGPWTREQSAQREDDLLTWLRKLGF